MQLSTTRPVPSGPTPGHWLEERVRRDPARPLIVWYGPGDERVELSAITFSNWVDKTINLFGDLGVEEAPVVGAQVIAERAGHWMSMVVAMAVWQSGGELLVESPAAMDGLDLAVVGPSHPHPVPGVDTIACSLDPLGRGFESLPRGMFDAHDVLAQPDVHTPVVTPEPSSAAWTTPQRQLSHAELADVAPEAGRRLVAAAGLPGLDVVQQALLAPLAGGGSAVVLEGETDPVRLGRIAANERATR